MKPEGWERESARHREAYYKGRQKKYATKTIEEFRENRDFHLSRGILMDSSQVWGIIDNREELREYAPIKAIYEKYKSNRLFGFRLHDWSKKDLEAKYIKYKGSVFDGTRIYEVIGGMFGRYNPAYLKDVEFYADDNNQPLIIKANNLEAILAPMFIDEETKRESIYDIEQNLP